MAVPTPAPAAAAESWTDKLSVGGFAVLWWMPAPKSNEFRDGTQGDEAFRFRFVRLDVKAKPTKVLNARVMLALETSPVLYNAELTWLASDKVNVTAGQTKVPFSSAILSSGANLMMMDRASFTSSMTKSSFRDVGIMVTAPKNGLGNGMFYYWAGIFAGNGRVGTTAARANRDFGEVLFAVRALADVGPILLGGKNDHASVGVTYVRADDDALPGDRMDPVVAAAIAAAAKNYLGGALGIVDNSQDRVTQLVTGDVAVAVAGISVSSEIFFLTSKPQTGTSGQAMGFNFDVGYAAPYHLQPAARFEWFDQNTDADNDEVITMAAGVNYEPDKAVELSLFGARQQYKVMGESRDGMRLETRLVLRY